MTIKSLFKEQKELVLDSSVLIAYFTNERTDIVSLLDTFVFNQDSSLILYNHHVSLTEIYYILCRKINSEEARKILDDFSGVFNIISEKWLLEKAGLIKCKFPISLADCYSIALGISQDCPILFMEEQELSKDIVEKINKKFNAKIHIIA